MSQLSTGRQPASARCPLRYGRKNASRRAESDGSHFAVAELMDEFAATALAVVWCRGPWKCVYSKRANGQSWVVLYHQGEIALKRRVLSIEEMLDVARFWKEAMAADLPLMERRGLAIRPDRRQLPDRRRVVRGGRRVSDRR